MVFLELMLGEPMGDYLMSKSKVAFKFHSLKDILLEKFPNNFFYVGIVKGLEKRNLLKESAIFVLPTYHKTEAFPISLIEAMRFGNAVISSNHNYLNEIITSNNGYLIDVNSTEHLIEKVNFLLENEKILRNIQAFNIQDAIDNYSPKTFNKHIYNIISKK